jgi:hypothetical protein
MNIYYANKNAFIASFVSLITLVLLYFPFGEISLDFFHNDDHILMAKLEGINSISDAFKFIFNTDAFKFRPLANFQHLMEFMFFQKHFTLYIAYNLLLIVALNYFLLLTLNELVKCNLTTCLMVSICIVASKFLVYSAWNITGSFETLAAILFVLTIYFSYTKKLLPLTIFSVLLIITSERFLPFILVLPILYGYLNSNVSIFYITIKKIPYSILVLLIYAGMRLLLDTPIIVGTQTDNISESFQLSTFLSHVFQSYSEIFGFSWGPLHLTGFKYADWVPFSALKDNTPFIFQYWLYVVLLIISLYIYLFTLFSVDRKSIFLQLAIGSLICAASITFRLELRWLLPVFVGFLLISTNSFYAQVGLDIQTQRFKFFIFYLFLGLLIFSSMTYHFLARKSLYFADKLHSVSAVSVYIEPKVKSIYEKK